MPEPWLSAGDIVRPLGVTKDSDYSWVNEKRTLAGKLGWLWKFQVRDVDVWVRNSAASQRSGQSKDGSQ